MFKDRIKKWFYFDYFQLEEAPPAYFREDVP